MQNISYILYLAPSGELYCVNYENVVKHVTYYKTPALHI